MKPRQDDTSREMGEGYALMTIGITFALAVALFVAAGLWLDRRLRTMPLFTIAGTFVGMGLGGFWLWQRLKQQARDDASRR